MKTSFKRLLVALCLALPLSMQAEEFFEVTVPDVARNEVICFALYTVDSNILKMTAQLYPLQDNESKKVYLDIKQKGQWEQVDEADVIEKGWVGLFRVENWDSTKDAEYRVRHDAGAEYTGIIKKDPVNKDEIVVAAFTGNSIYPQHGGDIPRDDIVANIKKIKPDLLFFSGDQVYDHTHHYEVWLKFGRDFGDIIKDIPTITIPDDHDIGQGNIWGSSGKVCPEINGNEGGYFMPAEYVKEVERCQTSHLPDPYDPTPVQQGIGVYYTDMTLGGISFAILEDRKFKTGFLEVLKDIPENRSVAFKFRHDYDPKQLDVPEAKLLGDRQLAFLADWAQDWENATYKCVLSQTVLCDSADRYYMPEKRRYVDFDANGWPQTGRDKAVHMLRRCQAFHINGDTHLATIFQYGINDYDDAGWSFTVPSIANLYMRWWDPDLAGVNHVEGMPSYTGGYKDGFGNYITCWAAANPRDDAEPWKQDNKIQLHTRAAGFGIVRFDKANREITMECWPRNVDITNPATKQYEGWPRTIKMEDNYGRDAIAYLPNIKYKGSKTPLIKVVDEKNDELVYIQRTNENPFTPKVFSIGGTYRIEVGEGETKQVFKGVAPLRNDEKKTITVKW